MTNSAPAPAGARWQTATARSLDRKHHALIVRTTLARRAVEHARTGSRQPRGQQTTGARTIAEERLQDALAPPLISGTAPEPAASALMLADVADLGLLRQRSHA